MTKERALELAAQAWCTPETAGRFVDPVLASAFADILVREAGINAATPGCQANDPSCDGMDEELAYDRAHGG